MKKPKYSNIEFAKDLWHFFRKEKKKFIFYTLLLIIASAFGLIPAILLAKIISFNLHS